MNKKPIQNIDVLKFKRNPYPDLKEMRANNPICFVPQLNATMICDRDSIYECEKNIEVFITQMDSKIENLFEGIGFLETIGRDHFSNDPHTIFNAIESRKV